MISLDRDCMDYIIEHIDMHDTLNLRSSCRMINSILSNVTIMKQVNTSVRNIEQAMHNRGMPITIYMIVMEAIKLGYDKLMIKLYDLVDELVIHERVISVGSVVSFSMVYHHMISIHGFDRIFHCNIMVSAIRKHRFDDAVYVLRDIILSTPDCGHIKALNELSKVFTKCCNNHIQSTWIAVQYGRIISITNAMELTRDIAATHKHMTKYIVEYAFSSITDSLRASMVFSHVKRIDSRTDIHNSALYRNNILLNMIAEYSEHEYILLLKYTIYAIHCVF